MFFPKMFQGWGGVGHVGVGGGGSWWGGSYTEQLGYRGQPSLSAHFTTLAITWNYWGSKNSITTTHLSVKLRPSLSGHYTTW